MELQLSTFLIVCPMVFLAGFVDAIGGGGGLISLPGYLLAGIPMHLAVGTNKMSSMLGTIVSTIRICKNTVLRWKLILPAIVLALLGSHLGTRLNLVTDEQILKHTLIVVLPIVAFFVLRKDSLLKEKEVKLSEKTERMIVWGSAFVIGAYDGFYGPGTGTFFLLIFIGAARMRSMEAAAYTKLLNLSSNVASFVTFLFSGHVMILLGLTAAVFSIAGHYTGAGMVMKNGTKIIRPIILIVLALLFIKILFGL